ncbi:MAG: hypothetical protein R3A79_13985 [Nannocystaceae bacterium]
MNRVQAPAVLLSSLFLLTLGCSGGGESSDSETAASASTSSTGASGPTGDPSGTEGGSAGETEGGSATAGTDSTGDSDSDTGEPDEPHALGTIVLGERHPATGGSATPSVSAFFVPDAEGGAAKSCNEVIAGCELAKLPDCDGSCESDQYCGWSDSCTPTCLQICDAECNDGEVCYFPSPGTTGCKKIESFDAGALSFIGTPIPITLFPPYVFMGDDGSPFSSGGTATIQASGAAGAGYEAFERDFTATQFIQTSPTLDKIGFTEVFGSGDIPVSWVPGSGDVTITATVTAVDFTSGTITCEVDDAAGSFKVPRAALEGAIGGETVNGLTLAITRRGRHLHTDLTTKGELVGQTVQPVGWLEVITSSTEFHAYMGCAPGEAICDDSCVDVQYDDANCGDCGETCADDDYCDGGLCVGPTACYACFDDSLTGACKSAYDACQDYAPCKTFSSCYGGCQTQACADACVEAADNQALNLYDAIANCVCDVGCVQECADLC